METETPTQNNELVRVIETSGLDKTKAQVLLDKFTGYFEIASEWERKTKELIVNDISQVTEMKMAREARLFLSKKRIDIEKTRKALKEDSLREGQTIDAIAKILKNLIEPIENELEKKERFAEIKEAERKAELKAERTEKLLPYAMVLGVAKIWAKEFEGIYSTPPSWYSEANNTGFNAVVFTNSLSNFSSYATSSMISSPSGSGSGGGGFSGGGGGGGGGGSW